MLLFFVLVPVILNMLLLGGLIQALFDDSVSLHHFILLLFLVLQGGTGHSPVVLLGGNDIPFDGVLGEVWVGIFVAR